MSDASAPLLAVVGPTASGKTALALELAERLGGEIVSADSVQVYRGVEVGTGKPTVEDRCRVPHHLLDVVELLEPMDAARWAAGARAAIRDVEERGRVPILCGGTFLFVRALSRGLAAAPPADAALRAELERRAALEGRAALHEELARVDPVTAARLAPNDLVRVSRALEVYLLSGRPLSELHAAHARRPPERPLRLVGIAHDKAELTRRIEARARSMLAAGWREEVQGLLARDLGRARALGSVGYRQIVEHLTAGLHATQAELLLAITRATRVFARRQLTWLRDEPVQWLAPDELPRFVQLLRAARGGS